ncbi:uncharacterized protein PAE49_012615 [Odontesthes bonariensis]
MLCIHMRRKMRLVVLCYVFVFHVQPCRTNTEPKENECKAIRTENGTYYSVPGSPCGSHCSYSWQTKSGNVIANQGNQRDEQVINGTNKNLLTKTCHEGIKYECECFHNGEQYNVTCVANCSGAAGLQKEQGIPSKNWLIPLIVGLTVVLTVVLIGGLIYKFRATICRYYTAVRTQDQPV